MTDKKNVFIMTDVEGVSEIEDASQIDRSLDSYQRTRELLMSDVNAAIAGVKDAGADQVYVIDGHGGGRNFIPEALDPRAIQVPLRGDPDFSYMKTVGAVLLIGTHAKAGTDMAFLEHTQWPGVVYNYYYNGITIGEISQVAAFGAAYGVPLVTVTGDLAACEEAKALFPDVNAVVVKTAISATKANCISAQQTADMIYKASKIGFENRHDIKPMELKFPLTISVDVTRVEYCENYLSRGGVKIGPRTVQSIRNEIVSFGDTCV